MHKIFIIGNLVRDPELRTTENGTPKCTFDVAVNRRKPDAEGKKLADFYRVTAWRQLGEVCSRYLQKGKQVSVVGDFEPHKFTTKDGVMQISLEINATDVEFMRGQDQPSVPARLRSRISNRLLKPAWILSAPRCLTACREWMIWIFRFEHSKAPAFAGASFMPFTSCRVPGGTFR